MYEAIKQTAEAITNSPKMSAAMAAGFNLNVWWLDYGEPIVKALTGVFGLVVLVLLVIKHLLDIKKSLKDG